MPPQIRPMALACFLLLSACSEPPEPVGSAVRTIAQIDEKTQTETPATLGAAAIAENNRGVGLMGQFDYAAARDAFAGLVAAHPGEADLAVNLAIATLNRQQEGDEAAALAQVEAVIAQDPGRLRAQYVAGLLRLYLSSPAEAQAHFRTVAEADPTDPYADYYLGQCLAQQGDQASALDWYRKALTLDPYLRSAYYGAFQAEQRLGHRDQARALMEDYQRLANNPQARLAEFKYTRMGPKAQALALGDAQATTPSIPTGPILAQPQAIEVVGDATWPAPAVRPLGASVADLDGDGLLDILVPDAGPGILVLLGTPDSGFRSIPDHPLSGIDSVNAALWGDYDNDGLTDLYLARRGPNRLLRQASPGVWEDVTVATGTAARDLDTLDGAFFDADHDGDLDLFLVNADGPNELLNNNLDGTFRPLATEQGIAGPGNGRQVLPLDLDADRDADLIVLTAEPPHQAWLNDRLWAYSPAPGLDAFLAAPVLAALAADLDADGAVELYGLGPDGRLLAWTRGPDGTSIVHDLATLDPGAGAAWGQLALADLDGDGALDLIASGPWGWSALNAQGQELAAAEVQPDGALTWVAPILLDPTTGPALVGLTGEGPRLWPPGPGRGAYVSLTLSGLADASRAMRSNASGVGTKVGLQVGSHWGIASTLRPRSGPGQDLQPLSLGIGSAAQADFAAIDWSDGVFQSELGLAPGQIHPVVETQRQLSSCPVLFTWDGDRYAFVTDLLGVGGMGYAVGPGEYAEPRPWEYLLLPEGLAQPRDGRFQIKLTEPMEEATYLDSARLTIWDLPPGWQMVLDERMGISPPEPTGAPRFYRSETLPRQVLDQDGRDLTTVLSRADGEAAGPGPLDRRFVGRLAGEQVLTLSFAQPLDADPGEPVLVADGWIEYPYSQTSFAAWQAGASFDAPSLDARGADGTWHRLLTQFGYPAGMPRRLSVPLQDLPPGTDTLRLSGNLELYWDRLAVAYAEPLPQADRRDFPPISARLTEIGFPRRLALPQARPGYSYARRSPFWDTRAMAGHYTRLGPVDELVAQADDALAIIGPGEEIHLEFAAPPPPPTGWTRRLVLETHGWSKDMDLYTKDGETLAPLPETGQDQARRDALHAAYNTRWRDGR